MRQLVLIMAAFFSFSGAYGQNPLVINYLTGNAARDTYYPELIKLALEKTRAGYGEYRLLIAPDMPHNRRVEFIQQNQQVNTFSVFGYEEAWASSKNLVPIY